MRAFVSKTVLAACIGVLSIPAFGQDVQEAYQRAVDKIFSGIPVQKVTTGILIERAPTFVDMYRYERENKEIIDTCNVKKWKQMYLQLNVAHLDSRKFKYNSRIVETDYWEKLETGDIPLGIIFYDYNRISHHALNNGLLSIDTIKGVVRDISGRRDTPLETVTCFAASPMVEILPTTGTYSFHLEPTLFVSNKTQSFDKISVDFGDGKGFVPLPVGGRVFATFDKPGVHTLTLEAMQEGITYLSRSSVYVQEITSLSRPVLNPEQTPNVFVDDYYKAGIHAQYGIWYRCNHDNTIRKPFLIVSGFDPSDDVRVQGEYVHLFGMNILLNRLYLYAVANKDGFLDRLRENGYDIICYRSKNSKESIIDNAMNLVELIKQINNEKTSNNELVIVGASMGGLVARYALTYMEQPHIDDHQTRLFVSLDSPQNGANIPLGFQHMVSSLSSDLNGMVTIVKMLKDAEKEQLGCVAAMQMLLYHHTATTGSTAQCALERTTFLNNLAGIGNFPQKCQSLAISMGSGTGVGQGFSAGQTLLKKNQSVIGSTFLNITGINGIVNSIGNGISGLIGSPSWTDLTWEFEVKAVPNHTSQTIYNEKISIKITFWLLALGLPIPVTITENLASPSFVVNNTDPLDNAPGSTKGLHNLTDFFDSETLPNILSFFGTITKEPNRDGFIPAYSALGLSVSPHTHIKNYLNANMIKINNNDRFYRNYNKTVSPFDYLYIEESNMFHIADNDNNSVLTSSMVEIMSDLLIPAQLDLGDRIINSGQFIAYEAESIMVNGNFIVQPGGHLDMKAEQIVLKPGFHAKAGSTVHLEADISWICSAGSLQSVSFSPLSSLAFKEVSETQFESEIQVNLQTHPKNLQTHPTEQKIENEVRFFPNPVENILNMQILNGIEGNIRITIINSTGQTVYSQLIMNNADNTIDFSQFNSGLYFINIVFRDGIQTIKIIKQ